jgi:hypothetical protein
MRYLKVFESHGTQGFKEIKRERYEMEIFGGVGDKLWSSTEVMSFCARPVHKSPVATFDPSPDSLMPAFARRAYLRPHKNAVKLDYPSNTVPITPSAAIKYLKLFVDLNNRGRIRDLIVVVSHEDSPDDRYLLHSSIAMEKWRGHEELVGLMTNAPVEFHQLTIWVINDGGYTLTFLDDGWVMFHALSGLEPGSNHFNYKGWFKCDGRDGVAQALGHVKDQVAKGGNGDYYGK